MLRDSDAAARAARRACIAAALVVASASLATAGCGIKGPLRPATPPPPASAPSAPDASLPPADQDSTSLRKP